MVSPLPTIQFRREGEPGDRAALRVPAGPVVPADRGLPRGEPREPDALPRGQRPMFFLHRVRTDFVLTQTFVSHLFFLTVGK